MTRRFCLWPALLALAAPPAQADAVFLRDGAILSGRIVTQNPERIVVRLANRAELSAATRDIVFVARDQPRRDWIRYVDTPDAAPAGLRVATVVYRHPRSRQVVSLVGAIHIGETAYYRELRRILDVHDRVLYELVTGGNDDDFSRFLRTAFRLMQDFLQLDTQKSIVDYAHPPANWVHADLSWPDLQRRLGEAGLSLQPPGNIEQLEREMKMVFGRLAAGSRAAGPAVFKAAIGQMMALSLDLETLLGRLGLLKQQAGAMSRLMDWRNEHAIEVLKGELAEDAPAAPRPAEPAPPARPRSIALFYGAGHMDYFDAELRKLGFKPIGTHWSTAWAVSPHR